MKKLGFALIGATALLTAACGRNDSDTLNESATDNSAELNDLAGNAAADAAAEMEALGNQKAEIEAEANATANTAIEAAHNEAEASTSPSEVEDNVQGM